MAANHDTWKVLPHDPVETLDDGLLTVEGQIPMPLGKFPRRMTVVRLADGGTLVWSAICLDAAGMAQVEALGEPRLIVVPNRGHRFDVKPWHDRYPAARVLCPPGAREKVEELVPVAATDGDTGDRDVRLATFPGVKADEFAMTIRHPDGGTTLVLNDMLANVRHPKGLGANIMARLFGFGVHGPRVSRLVKRMFVSDAGMLAGQFRAWSELPGLKRVIVSHGDVIAHDPAGELRTAASKLV